MANNEFYPDNERFGNVKSTFGDQIIAPLQPQTMVKATYGLTSDVETFSATGGSVTASGSEFVCQSGTSLGGYGLVWSRQPLVYRPGVGGEARFTARFDTPVSLSTQLAGLFTAADGMFFGYDGETFGTMHRYGGAFEIQEFTVTNPAAGAETVTVTLNGTPYTASVTAGTAQQNAHEIEVGLNAGAAASLWYIQHIDDTVVCIFRGVGAKSGSYSISSTGALTGTVTQVKAGATPTETWTPQTSWNKYSNIPWFDPSKGNLYRVEFAYLGYGPIRYYIMHPVQKHWVCVNEVDWPGNNQAVNFGNPAFRVGWASASLGSTGTNLTVAGASGMAALQGNAPRGDRLFGAVGTNTNISTETQILSVQVRREFGGQFANCLIFPDLFMATDSTKGMIFRVYLNATVAGVTNHQYVNQAQSVCLYDTDGTTVTGGTLLGAYVAGPNGSITIDLEREGVYLTAGDEITITGQVTSGAAAGGYVTVNTREVL